MTLEKNHKNLDSVKTQENQLNIDILRWLGIEQISKVPQLSEQQRKTLIKNMPVYYEDFKAFRNAYLGLAQTRPEVFRVIQFRIPRIQEKLDILNSILKEDRLSTMKEQELVDMVNSYNDIAKIINITIVNGLNEEDEKRFNERIARLSIQEREDARIFAEILWNELFPESSVSKTVRYYTGQEKLDDIQKVLIAPANGIEGAISAFISLFNLSTYQEFGITVRALSGMSSDEWMKAVTGLKQLYSKMSGADQASIAIIFISWVVTLFGGISKMLALTKIASCPTWLKSFIVANWTIRHIHTTGAVVHGGVMTELSLRYIKP